MASWSHVFSCCAESYGEICPEEGIGFDIAASKNIKPQSGCVVKVFTGEFLCYTIV